MLPALVLAVSSAAASLSGTAGVYAIPLGSAPAAALNADELFPTASLIKVPILAAVFDKLDRGELSYDAPLVYRSTRAYGEDMLSSFVDGSTLSVSRLAFLTAKMSDNTAALWLQELAGGGAGVNAWLAKNGYEKTRVNSRTPGREADKKLYGWGQASPRELTRLFESIALGTCVSPAASAELVRVLTGSFWDGSGLSVLPPSAAAISKQGFVDASRGECVAVTSGKPYAYCALTKGLTDHTYVHDHEGARFLRTVAAAAYREIGGGVPVTGTPPRYWKQE